MTSNVRKINDKDGNNKLWLIEKIQMVLFSTEIGLHVKSWDFKYGVLSLDSQMVNIHYHLKCQGIRENAGDNKLWLFRWIQMIVFATEMGYLHDKGWDLAHGVLFLDSQMVNIHYHLKYQENTDSAGDNKFSLIQ